MGEDVAEISEVLPSPLSIKVHHQMCSKLLELVARVSRIFPEIEAARPRCSDTLCLLNNGISRAKNLLQQCSESSKLYLALTGDAILSRCNKSRNLMEQSLSEIQDMVPVMLASKISGVISDLRRSTFCLDPSEEEAGKILGQLLHRYGSATDSVEEDTLGSIQVVSSKLHITSWKSLLIEKRSINKLLKNFGKSDSTKKRKILLFFLSLLNKYGDNIMKEKTDNSVVGREDAFPFASSYDLSTEVDLSMRYRPDETQIDILSSPIPPKEFICPLSSRLMYDPVVIASGQTFERAWIQSWFDEGHDACPMTKVKLTHLSLTSNNGMRDLISKWCAAHAVSFPHRNMQAELVNSCDTSANSISSLTSSLNDLCLPLDLSGLSDVLCSNSTSGVNSRMKNDNVSSKDQSSECTQEMNMEIFAKISTLPWDSQCTVVEQVKRWLTCNDEAYKMISSGNFVEPLLRFMKDAHDIHDVEAQLNGCQLLLEFVQKRRKLTCCMDEDAYSVLGSYLDDKDERAEAALAILKVVSMDKHCGHKISAATGALDAILNIVEQQQQQQQQLEAALQILSNLSSNGCFLVPPPTFIPKLVPLFENNRLATHCVAILKNLCRKEDARCCVAESDGCISSICKLLESECDENQEHAVDILLSLCSERVQYCELVMDEGVIPALVSVSVNGNERAKAMAVELRRILNDEFHHIDEECSASDDVAAANHSFNPPLGLFGRILSIAKTKKKKKN